jgi:hypothetical protein
MSDTQTPDRTSGAPRSPEELQRAADAIRADLDRTLELLERKLSPRRIANRSVDLVRRSGTSILHKAGEAAVKHPIPALLASAGIVWLASSKRRARAASHYREDAGSTSKSWLKAAAAFTPTAIGAARTVARKTRLGSGTRLGRIVRDHPVLCGTAAAALGAAVSTAVPATRYEREAAGPLFKRAAQILQQFATLKK